jgi:prepilin-type processing-associated H-X9-DG protein
MFYFWTWQGEPVVWPPVATPVPTEKAAEDLALTQHSTGANWLYGDGHVRWTPFSRLWKGGSENPFSPGAVASPQFSGS